MSKFLNIGFIAIIIAAATRFFISESLGTSYVDFNQIEEWELWLYSVSIAWLFLAFWNALIRRKCPKCHSYDYSKQGSEEIDRWVGSKQERVRVDKDTYANRSTTTTFVKIKYFFQCLQCENNWTETLKQEKN